MDLQTALLCGGVAAFSAVVIYVISMFSMREKTYEEAIAEQRKMPEENLLLGRSSRDKAKDKKQKKLGKKVKEKASDHDKNDHTDVPKQSSAQPAKVHVDFEEPEAEVVSERLPQDGKKKKKKEKVKSILLNKDERSIVVNSPLTPSNHFEEILPKDDLLLKRKESREENVLKNNAEPSPQENAKIQTSKSNAKADASSVSNKREEEKVVPSKVEKVNASKAEKVVPSKVEKVVPSKAEKVVPSKAEKVAPPKAEKVVPSKVEKVVPSKVEKVNASKVEKVAPPKVEKVVPSKVEKVSGSKPERVNSANREEKDAEKKKDNSAKQDKVSPKSEKNVANKAEKPSAAAKSEKQASNKTEKAAAPAKVSPKSEKTTAEKVEKVPPVKGDKTAAPSTTATKPEKPAGKQENSSHPKNEKQNSKQEKNVTSQPAPVSSQIKEVTIAAPVVAPAAKHEAAPVANAVPAKERSRKRKSELATLQQMSGERDGVNMSLLLPIVQKAELSRSEIQILIDHLLNKQQNAGVSDAEWIEGRQDPVVKLKKQLAEKEKALTEEQEALQGVQAKLKELRQEFNSERSRLSHSCRQLEESLAAKTNEAQVLATRLQHTQDAVTNEKQSLGHQVQQLQQKLNEEHVRLCQLQEQEGQLQQELLNQRQQMELHISHLNEQEGTLKTQVTQLMAQLKEQEAVNTSLNLELQGIRDSQMGENNMLHERVAHAEKQLHHYKESVEQSVERAQELAQQVEELRMIRGDLEHRLTNSQQHEKALQYEINNVRQELEDLKAQLVGYEALKNDSNRLRSENDKLGNQIHQFKDIQLENQRLLNEIERLSQQVVVVPELQREALQLREENENLAAQLTAMTERPAAEGRENGDIQFHEEKRELLKGGGDFAMIEKTIQQKEGQVLQLTSELEEKSSVLKQLQSEINTYKTDISKLNSELDEQRRKNNEISQKIYSEQQNVTKQLLQRIFPEIKIEDCKNFDSWLEQFESKAALIMSDLQSKTKEVAQSKNASDNSSELEELEQQNASLQAAVANYKTIIDDTAGMLKQLQNQVEEGEIRWKQQLQVKEAELEAVKQELTTSSPSQDVSGESSNVATQNNVEDLQAKLKLQDQEKLDLEAKFTALTRNIEQMKEEKDGLSSELSKEQEKSRELSKELVRLRSLVQIGKDSLNQEHEMVVNLQQQVDKLNGVHQNHNVASNGPSTETSTVAQGGSGKK